MSVTCKNSLGETHSRWCMIDAVEAQMRQPTSHSPKYFFDRTDPSKLRKTFEAPVEHLAATPESRLATRPAARSSTARFRRRVWRPETKTNRTDPAKLLKRLEARVAHPARAHNRCLGFGAPHINGIGAPGGARAGPQDKNDRTDPAKLLKTRRASLPPTRAGPKSPFPASWKPHRCDASQPPPRALINWTLATIRCARYVTPLSRALSRAVWAAMTFKYGSSPAL